MSKFAKRMDNMEETSKIVRSLFGSMIDKEVISFGGGAPANEVLPIDIIREISNDILKSDSRGIESLAYGPIIGVYDLRQVIVTDLLQPKGIMADVDNIFIVNGGLEAMNLLAQIFIEPGDVILVEAPTFVQSIQIFDMFEANCIPVKVDDDGIDIIDLEEKILEYNPKMIYIIPTFQNPSGRTLSLERRKKVAEFASKYDVLVLEDDPYRDIRFSGEEILPIKSFDETGHVILANSFSKIFSPGVRLGYIYTTDLIIEKLLNVKLATNSHTAILPQVICAEFFKRGYYPKHHKMICDLYRERKDAMIESIDKYFPVGTKRTNPDGGLFCWVELPEHINTTDLHEFATTDPQVKVTFLPGEKFYPRTEEIKNNCMRLSFGNVEPNKIREGIRKLGNLFNSKM